MSDPLGKNVKITLVYDSSPEDFMTDFIAGYYGNSSYGLNLQLINGGSDRNSFLITLAMIQASQMPNHDLIYLLENDYMHQSGWVSKVFELYNSNIKFDMVSLYDHRDKYDSPMYDDLTAKIFYSPSHHWRTAPSTCASFILSRAALQQDMDVLGQGLNDYFFFSKLIGERGRTLLTPLPGLATHSMEGYLSPTVQWDTLVY
jgi:hypothetical protein